MRAGAASRPSPRYESSDWRPEAKGGVPGLDVLPHGGAELKRFRQHIRWSQLSRGEPFKGGDGGSAAAGGGGSKAGRQHWVGAAQSYGQPAALSGAAVEPRRKVPPAGAVAWLAPHSGMAGQDTVVPSVYQVPAGACDLPPPGAAVAAGSAAQSVAAAQHGTKKVSCAALDIWG